MRLFQKKPVYLDYASAHPVYPRVLCVLRSMQNLFDVNPTGLALVHQQARTAINDSRHTILQLLNVQNGDLFFAHSGTEANMLAIIGTLSYFFAQGHRDMHVFTTAVEHSSVHSLLQQYASIYAYTVHMIPLCSGQVDCMALQKMLNAYKPILVSVQYVNNETGIVQPIAAIAKIIRGYTKNASLSQKPLFHTDAIQAYYEDIAVDRLGVDLLTLSSGKVGGPRGASVVYAKNPKMLRSYLGEGSQEKGLFPGTENTYAIVGFAKAFAQTRDSWQEKRDVLLRKRSYMAQKLRAFFPDCIINECADAIGAHILSISIADTDSEQLVIGLSAHGVIASAKSACTSLDGGQSHVLKALYGDSRHALGTVRFSFGIDTPNADLLYAVKKLHACVQLIKKGKMFLKKSNQSFN